MLLSVGSYRLPALAHSLSFYRLHRTAASRFIAASCRPQLAHADLPCSQRLLSQPAAILAAASEGPAEGPNRARPRFLRELCPWTPVTDRPRTVAQRPLPRALCLLPLADSGTFTRAVPAAMTDSRHANDNRDAEFHWRMAGTDFRRGVQNFDCAAQHTHLAAQHKLAPLRRELHEWVEEEERRGTGVGRIARAAQVAEGEAEQLVRSCSDSCRRVSALTVGNSSGAAAGRSRYSSRNSEIVTGSPRWALSTISDQLKPLIARFAGHANSFNPSLPHVTLAQRARRPQPRRRC